jgi:non-ribosomal peptide synthetase component F
VPLRISLGDDPTVRQLLRRVRDSVLDGLAHSELPFDRLVENLRPERSLSRMPIFQTLFDLQEVAPLHLLGLAVTPVDAPTGAAQFDVSLSMQQTADHLEALFTYDTDLFDASRIERMASHLEVLFEGMAANPDQTVSSLPLLSQPDRQRVTVTWNDTAAPVSASCLHELVEHQVRQRPEAPAVRFEETVLTCAELDARASQLARRLAVAGASVRKCRSASCWGARLVWLWACSGC